MENKDTLKNYLYQATRVLNYTKPRPFLEYVAENIRNDSKLLVVEAPTGYGKTTLSIAFTLSAILNGGLKAVVTYPLRSLLEQQLSRFKSVYTKLGFDEKVVGARYMQHAEAPYLIRPVTLTTIDTLSLTALGLSPEDIDKAIKKFKGFSHCSMGHYLFSRAMFSLSWLVLDEVHLLADSTKSLSFLIALLRLALINDQKVLMLSATLPKAMADILKKETNVELIRFSDKADQSFLTDRERKKYRVNIEALDDDWSKRIYIWLKNSLKEREKAIIVFNTVERAVLFYEKIVASNCELKINKNEVLLLHSRFMEDDRRSKMNRLDEGKWRILITTQVIEAGVDISSDLFITELAPANSLIQRLGRFLRREGEEDGEVYMWYDKKALEKAKEPKYGKYTVYDIDLVIKTLSILENKSRINFHDPRSYQSILDEVYSEDYYIVNRGYIEGINTAYFQLNKISYAVDLFLNKVEGSFVRENTMVPVVTEGININKSEDVIKVVLPLGLDLVYKYLTGCFHVDEEGNIVFDEIDVSKLKIKDLLKISLKPNFLAFAVKGTYDEEKGLLLEWRLLDESD